MRIIMAGGSGFLGRALSTRLAKDGHAVVILTRDAATPRAPGLVRYAGWTPNGETGSWAHELDGADAIVNLAGAGIADKRWSAARQRVLRDSRVLSTRSLVNAVRSVSRRPGIFVQGSAAGFYGAFDDGPELDESSSPGSDFLGRLAVEWEAEAQPASALGCRLVHLRTGVVLSNAGGAVPKMALPFKAFLGGPLGSGRQYLSWVHLDDYVGMTSWALGNPAVSGPVNVTAPHPVTNAEFSRALGRALHRPSFFPVPGFVLRLIVGRMADDALLRGQRVLPRRARELGYRFLYEDIAPALQSLF